MIETKFLITKTSGGVLHAIIAQSSQEKEDSNGKLKPVILLMHGFSGEKNEWGRYTHTAEMLSNAGYDSLRFDFTGSGENDREPITLKKQVEDVAEVVNWVKSQGYQKIGAIGLSFGGLTLLVASNPHITVNVFWAPGFYFKYVMKPSQKLLVKIGKKLFPNKTMERGNSFSNLPPVLITADFAVQNLTINTDDYLKSLKVPSLIIHGTADVDVPIRSSEEAINLMPKEECYKLIKVENATHNFNDKLLDEFIQHSIEWFEKYLL